MKGKNSNIYGQRKRIPQMANGPCMHTTEGSVSERLNLQIRVYMSLCPNKYLDALKIEIILIN